MRFAVTITLTLAIGISFASNASAQLTDQQSYIRSLYEKYLGVQPPPDQLGFWMTKMRTGMSAEEVNANILGSQAFFLQHQGQPESFIRGAFLTILGRAPSPDELAYWLDKYRREKGDTVKWAREFLRSNGGRLPPGQINPPGFDHDDYPQRLLTTCNLFYQAARQECSGTAGWTVVNQGRNFVDYVSASMSTLRNPSSNLTGYQQVIQNLENGVTGVRTALANPALHAPQTQLYNNQIEQLLISMRREVVISPGVPGPIFPVPPVIRPPIVRPPVVIDGLSARESRQLGEDAQQMSQAVEQAEYYLRGESLRDWRLARLARDLEQLHTAAETFRSTLRPGASKGSVRASFSGLKSQVDSINQRITSAGIDPRFLQSWYQVIASLNRMGTTLGGIDAGPPPGFPNRPPNNGGSLRAVDRAISECDVLIAGFTPYVYYHASVPQLMAEVRSMRNQLTSIRQLIASDGGRFALRGQIREANSQLTRVQRYWAAAVGGARLTNAPSISGLERALDQLNEFPSGRN